MIEIVDTLSFLCVRVRVHARLFHLLCFHVFLRAVCVCFLLIPNSACSPLFCCVNTSALKAQRAAMSFSALPLLAPPDKCTCLFDTSIHMALSPLWLLVYTEHNNAIMKGRRGVLLLLHGICLKLELSPGQLQLCIMKLCVFV